jgi:uncharacterized protein YkwD
MFVRFVCRKIFVIGFLFSFSSLLSWKAPVLEATTYKDTLVTNPSKMAGDILELINQHRQAKGLSVLQANPVVTTQAQQHSADMAARKTPFGHDGFEDRVKQISQRLGPVRASAENVADGQLSAKEVVAGWLNSPGHRKNIEGNFSLTGIGIAADSKGTLFYTQIFVNKF